MSHHPSLLLALLDWLALASPTHAAVPASAFRETLTGELSLDRQINGMRGV